MPSCPRCHQPVDEQAIACPVCRTELKAHGHPGIPLYRASREGYLCDTCLYHADDTCNFLQRPQAKDCTLYRDRHRAIAPPPSQSTLSPSFQGWLRRHGTWVVLGLLIAVSLFLALSGR